MRTASNFKIIIGVWTAMGKIPSYRFRDSYIHLMDFTYPDISVKDQVMYQPLLDWIFQNERKRTESSLQLSPTVWLKNSLDISICLSIIFSEAEQKEVLYILQSRENKQNRG